MKLFVTKSGTADDVGAIPAIEREVNILAIEAILGKKRPVAMLAIDAFVAEFAI